VVRFVIWPVLSDARVGRSLSGPTLSATGRRMQRSRDAAAAVAGASV
jgi:hypothetical protein